MTTAAAIESRTAKVTARSTTSHIASIDVFGDLGEVEPIWRALEDRQHLSTPYQRFDFLASWQRNVGQRERLVPFIVVARDAARRPLLLLPLALKQESGIRAARFMGAKHATFNMALWNRDFAKAASTLDLEVLVAAVKSQSRIDVLSLHQQPLRWGDLPNPMAMLRHQASVNDCPMTTMEPGAGPAARVGNSLRRRLKSKERKLQSLRGYRYHVATDDADVRRLLDWFLRVKPLRMAEQKLPNVFAEPGVEDFIREACMTRVSGGGRAIDIHVLECNEEVIALFAGVADGYRFSMMFNTYTMSESARYSPGLILLRYIVDHYAEQGYRSLDLGIGSDDYKRMFCKDDEPIFDCFIPLSLRGKLATAAMSRVNRAKHIVKHSPALLSLAQKLRSSLHGSNPVSGRDSRA
jgi:CelD/BcsL family acetyltransferase involved in cellulose biosynthesis